MSRSREHFLSQWSPLIGLDSAIALRRIMITFFVALALLPLWPILITIGCTGVAAEAIAATLNGLTSMGVVIAMFHLRTEVSHHFGREISIFRLPPFRADKFQAWRRRMQI